MRELHGAPLLPVVNMQLVDRTMPDCLALSRRLYPSLALAGD